MSSLGNKQVMAANIQYYMDLNREDRQDVCKAIKVKYTTFCDWVNAKTYPRIDKIELLADHWGISKADLVEPRSQRVGKPTSGKRYPLLGTIAAGAPILADNHIEDYIEINVDVRADFVVRVKGDSMIDANIYDGDLVFIKQQPNVENGEIAAVMLIDPATSDGIATLKRVYKTDYGLQLVAENKAYAPIIINESNGTDAKILGKATYYLSQVK